ncbi:methylcobalamin methyltransferase [Desulfocucumis palustris]|uniref:Methylcobalamin methyltransferase n=1 Tax=Desulfocucumis palustris TaxID=1898651 RepID=A0A2L2XBS1_9FIRM|nr:uroporphyrinogen decarboxylase family protein [Desulfocucumis palustris]GBF33665.1 methylcobalamin methyltransferase [Desulfocucumis palustris]
MRSTEKIDALAEQLHQNVRNSGEYLTPLERFNSVHIYNSVPDRLLAWAFYREYPRYLVNYTVKDIETDHLKECESLLAGLVEFGYDTVWTNVDVYSVIPEVWGCPISMHEDAVSVPVGAVIKRPEDLEQLRPIDPYNDGRLSVVLNSIALLREKIGDIYPVLGHCTGPVSLASILRGGSKFVVDVKKRPEFVARLLDFCADQIITFAKAQLDLGATGVHMADAAGSPSMVSPQQYEEVFMPAYMKIQKALGHLTPSGARWHSQSGFETLDDLEEFLEKSLIAGNNIIHVSTPWSLKLDIVAIQNLCRKYGAVLWFGIDPASFANLTPEQLELQVKEYIEKYAKDFEGYFQIGPNMLNDTSKPELVKAYMEAMRKYGKCPVG